MTVERIGGGVETITDKQITVSYEELQEIRKLVKLGIEARAKLYTPSTDEKENYEKLLEKL
jgi:hypothetical protein